jgi:hypothetical protein
MSINQSIQQVNKELQNVGVHVSLLETIDWDEIFEHVPNSDEGRLDIVQSINNVATSVQRLKDALK